MPKIVQYEADPKIAPSSRAYEAAMVSGRRIGQLMREGNQDLQRGVTSLGSALEAHEVRQERAEAKSERLQARAEREQERQEAKAEKFQAKQERLAKQADDEKSQSEITQGIVSRAQLMSQLRGEMNSLAMNTPPAQLPAVLDKWRQDRMEPALQQWQQGFESRKGQLWAGRAVANDTNHMLYTQRADAATAQGHAVAAQLGTLHNELVSRVMNDPSAYKQSLDEWNHSVNGLIAHTPAVDIGGGGQGPQGEVAAALKARGWSDAAIIGALNNGQAESAWRPEIVNGSVAGAGGARGIFQFDPGGVHLAAYQNGGGDWSPKSQADYMAGVVEKEMPGYKDITDPAAATRQFMLGFERPKDQSPAAQQLRINNTQQSQTYLGGPDGMGFSPNVQTQLQNGFNKGLRDLAKARLYGTADKDPAAARALLANDPDIAKYLTEADKLSAPKYIDNRERLNTAQQKHDQLMQDQAARGISAQAALGYIGELHDQYGKPAFPADWNKRVADDPNLRPDEKQALVRMQERLGAQRDAGVTPEQRGWFSTTPEQRQPEVPTNPDTLKDVLKGLSGPGGGLSPAQIIDQIANGTERKVMPGAPKAFDNISTKDAEMLLWGIDPRNSTGEQTLAAVNNEINRVHGVLAPRNPDGSANDPGEAAFRRFMGEWVPQVRGAIKGGNGLSVLDPASPEYLLRDNKVQKYAAGHDDIANAARSRAGTDMTPAELNDIFNLPAAEMAQSEQPQVHGTGAPITEAQLSSGGVMEPEETEE